MHSNQIAIGGGVEGEEEEGRTLFLPTMQAFLLVQQISANIVSYCRVAMTIGGGIGGGCKSSSTAMKC